MPRSLPAAIGLALFLALPCFFLSALPAQTIFAEQEIRTLIARQAEAWNRGDVNGFMAGYEHATTTTFVGASITRGYQQVLERYLERYPTRQKMGALTFSNLEVQMLGEAYASAVGQWNLKRASDDGGDVGGYFTLLLRKTGVGWRIILDHTS
ncbi:YybH family protein [Gloeobacter kilaueensis]|uniref:DUF4440 domain-containing protein n=1 Tax=Gloeobacter kilaueensis (strain ATCC BAA-2537 / CCAP 1431/1 / ULC 316 / JS1) TaxID=1183438 RepID=U5QJW2_GLOK1|nr:DUF4440 domain-containing protein [Gloeobacter kilaueensis]AGY57884.1 hypothetical protein GKIL_1638 [Gloeobacter kilaueensis JS1]